MLNDIDISHSKHTGFSVFSSTLVSIFASIKNGRIIPFSNAQNELCKHLRSNFLYDKFTFNIFISAVLLPLIARTKYLRETMSFHSADCKQSVC